MDAAASIITLFAFVLASTRAVYETISGISDGPEIVHRAAQNLRHASDLLSALENDGLDALPESFLEAI